MYNGDFFTLCLSDMCLSDSLSNKKKWCIFFKCRHEQQAKPLIEKLCKKEEGILRAKKQVEKLLRSYL